VKVRRTWEVTIQTSETFVLRPSQVTVAATCVECATEVDLLAASAAAALVGVPLRWIYRWIENGQLHFQETASGLILVCPNSLQATVRRDTAEAGSQITKLEEI
jgi:hypothetical protein